MTNEINSLNSETDLEVPEISQSLLMSKLKKNELIIELVIQFRKLFDVFPSLESSRRKEARRDLEALYPPAISETNLRELISSDIFQLSDDVLNKDRYSNALD